MDRSHSRAKLGVFGTVYRISQDFQNYGTIMVALPVAFGPGDKYCRISVLSK
jgi:hypothetical protein